MRQIDDDARHCFAHNFEHGFKALRIHVKIAVKHSGRSKEAQVVGTFDEQTVEQHIVEAFRCHQSVGDALSRIMIEVETSGAESEVEVGDDHIFVHARRNAPTDIMRDCA